MDSPLKPDESLVSLARKVTEAAGSLSEESTPDVKVYRALQDATRKLASALETPGETIYRLAFSPLQASIVRAGLDLGIFELLVGAGAEGNTVGELADVTGAESVLLVRILRYLSAIGVIGQAEKDRFFATSSTRSLTVPTLAAGVKHMFDFVAPIFVKLPKFFEKTAYRNPTDEGQGAFDYTYSTNLDPFSYLSLPGHETMLRNFGLWMAGQREGFGFSSDWLEFFPFQSEVVDGYKGDESDVLVVDVGGGLGHEMISMRRRFPDLPGKLVVQDLPETIAQITNFEGVFDPAVHDIFTPQPVKGARVYYLRTVLHDWPDDKCCDILRQTIEAMKEGYSMIIINETVVPDVNAGIIQAQLDFTMLATLSALERSESDWRNLLKSAGLRVVNIWTRDELAESVIVAVRE